MSIENIQASVEGAGYKARKTKEGFQCQCPGHNGAALSLYVADKGEGRTVMFCQSYQCDAKDILEAVGLNLSELYPPRDDFDRKAYSAKKSQHQIERECVHAYLIIAQLPTMKANGLEPAADDVISIQKSMAVLQKYNFGEDEYFTIEEREQAKADEARLEDCDRALDEAREVFLQRGGRYD